MPEYKRLKKYELYLDESGTVGGKTGLFSLAGLLVEKKYRKKILDPLLESFKIDCFNNKNVNLHLKDILKKEKDFIIGNVTEEQLTKFGNDIGNLLKSLDIFVFSTTVDKARLRKYFKTPKDEYSIAFNHIMKSIYYFLDDNDVESLDIFMESREESQNFKVQKSFFQSYYGGSTHLDIKPELRDKIKRFTFKSKAENLSGLQIIDIVCLPIKKIRVYGYLDTNTTNNRLLNDIFDSIRGKMYVPEEENDVKNWSLKKVPIIKNPGEWIEDKD